MAKKRISGTKALFEETEAVAEALARQREHVARDVPMARIVPSRFNRRLDYSAAALGELTRSIHEHGFIGALDGRELADGRIELAYGSRRLLAARQAGLRTLPVAVHDWTDVQMCLISLAENLGHERLSDSDEGVMVRRLRDSLHLSEADIAQAVGKPLGWVTERLAVGGEPPEPEMDSDAVRIDEAVAGFVGAPTSGDGSPPVYGLDVSREADMGPVQAQEAGRPRAAKPLPESRQTWFEKGCAMLTLANDNLDLFDPSAVADEEVDAALGWLKCLDERVEFLRAALQRQP